MTALRVFLLALIADQAPSIRQRTPWRCPALAPPEVLAELSRLARLGVIVSRGGDWHLTCAALDARAAYRAERPSDESAWDGPGWIVDLLAWAEVAEAAQITIEQLARSNGRRLPAEAAI